MDASVLKLVVSNFIANVLPMVENVEAAANARAVIINLEIRNKFMKQRC